MVRRTGPRSEPRDCSPHSRGDGPRVEFSTLGAVLFSPLAWGWSVRPQLPRQRLTVLPTRVGMVRLATSVIRARGGSPHSRGDGPDAFITGCAVWLFSPLAWGWSGV